MHQSLPKEKRDRDTYNTKRHSRHADLQVTRRGGGSGLRGRLAEPAVDGEDDGRPADHLVAGEDLAGKVRVSLVEHEAGGECWVSCEGETYGGHGEGGRDGALEVVVLLILGTFGVGDDCGLLAICF